MVLLHGFITFAYITILSFSVLGMNNLKKTGLGNLIQDLKFKPVIFIDSKKVLSPMKRFWGKDKTREGSREFLFDQYSSFYETSQFFKKHQSQKESGLKALAIRVSILLNKPELHSGSLKSLLQDKQELANACEILASQALKTPEKLNSFERIWVVGILAGLTKGKQDFKIPKDLSNQVYLEIQAALHYEAQITKTFKDWIPNKKIGSQISGSRLEELLNRADIIGEHESQRPPKSNNQPIDNLVSHFLMEVELPKEENMISNIIGQLRQIFKTMEYNSREGRYTRDIFEHLSFYSTQFKHLLRSALEDGPFWRDLHISLVKNDVIELSNKLQPILQSFHVGIGHSLYEILKTPNPNPKYFEDAILNLLGKLKEISIESSENLIDAYNLLIAHSFLSSSAEETIITRIQVDPIAHSGISKALAAVYPDFVIEEVNVVDYRLRTPLLPPINFLYKSQKENRMDRFYIRVQDILKNHETLPDQSFGIGLEFLLIIIQLYPEHENYLIKYLNKDVILKKESLLEAIDQLTYKHKFSWRGEEDKLSNELKTFASKLKSKIQNQLPQAEAKNLVSMKARQEAESLSLVPLKKEFKIIIGKEEFDFNPQNWDSFQAPRSTQN
ncbi:uncharacterized protein MELLADRAFT_103137 [Melampsora larici-populina 98AG31]|uniref:Uncharacterized protein n=1 Tax=Melampsora larici-populina (strain 98AG31 / pathotype 3-4-7) TaxID=747676 RepID=F4RAN7_MELLP|nr:uncharacterized protein MELLADRAFT_103137 [Melampsora larici-populina 98AG31]EGG10753.1 hypothetical protein MELLADRAFT_103137 [Melampsora larici-populina 98AG31]